jgi:hypothetical protein
MYFSSIEKGSRRRRAVNHIHAAIASWRHPRAVDGHRKDVGLVGIEGGLLWLTWPKTERSSIAPVPAHKVPSLASARLQICG